MPRKAADAHIQFVADLFLSTIHDHLTGSSLSEPAVRMHVWFNEIIMDHLRFVFLTQHTVEGTSTHRRKSTTEKAEQFQIQKPVDCELLVFLSTLAEGIHAKAGVHPLDSLVEALSDQCVCDAIEGGFESATATADGPAPICSLRSVHVLLVRLQAHWKASACFSQKDGCL